MEPSESVFAQERERGALCGKVQEEKEGGGGGGGDIKT